MTPKKITAALKAIHASKEDGYLLEAVLKSYHLNISLVRFIFLYAKPEYSLEGKKLKTFTRDFSNEMSSNPALRSVINKKTFKAVKNWLDKMDIYFKQLRFEQPSNTKLILSDSEKVFATLSISANKLFAARRH
jgi:hypothetical protein